jgi:hypothetical protein
MDLLERLTRKTARTVTVNGRAALVTNGDPVLVEAFAHLGWSDPHVAAEAEPVLEAAVLGEPEDVATEKRQRARGHR